VGVPHGEVVPLSLHRDEGQQSFRLSNTGLVARGRGELQGTRSSVSAFVGSPHSSQVSARPIRVSARSA
jgi:hypothetical protein